MLLTYPKGLRVVVSTANLIESDWIHRTQAIWCQDFPLLTDTATWMAEASLSSISSASPPAATKSKGLLERIQKKSTAFSQSHISSSASASSSPVNASTVEPSSIKETLSKYLNALHIPHQSYPQQSSRKPNLLYIDLSLYDFSAAAADLVCSVYGSHENAERDSFGHLFLRKMLLQRERELNRMKEAEIERDKTEEKDIYAESASKVCEKEETSAIQSAKQATSKIEKDSLPLIRNDLVCQFSSFGTLTEEWLAEFTTSLGSARTFAPSCTVCKKGVAALPAKKDADLLNDGSTDVSHTLKRRKIDDDEMGDTKISSKSGQTASNVAAFKDETEKSGLYEDEDEGDAILLDDCGADSDIFGKKTKIKGKRRSSKNKIGGISAASSDEDEREADEADSNFSITTSAGAKTSSIQSKEKSPAAKKTQQSIGAFFAPSSSSSSSSSSSLAKGSKSAMDGNSMASFARAQAVHTHLHLVWPTVNEVAQSILGYSSGGSLCLSQKAVREFWKEYLCRWNGRQSGRQHMMPHSKIYTRVGHDGELRWAVITSANLSKAAWGFITKKNNSLRISNYECGVLLHPSLILRSINVHRMWGKTSFFSCTNQQFPLPPVNGTHCVILPMFEDSFMRLRSSAKSKSNQETMDKMMLEMALNESLQESEKQEKKEEQDVIEFNDGSVFILPKESDDSFSLASKKDPVIAFHHQMQQNIYHDYVIDNPSFVEFVNSPDLSHIISEKQPSFVVGMPIPFSLPPVSYNSHYSSAQSAGVVGSTDASTEHQRKGKEDEPWVWDVSYSKPDIFGQLWSADKFGSDDE
eukprot:MONOS_10975.1-p1 / transcript=MONOS_10975.1 / gene=MONOS_10975 / organism=Monocercomonoides_exilis_PA203 / gene_product=unspecified product / transcript_product=unspecified product / location=Mono_scaffold00524:147-3217(-) / protein_length=809 / sequence_SO=supercontig / SO=protein_coding / is_pseudo=false